MLLVHNDAMAPGCAHEFKKYFLRNHTLLTPYLRVYQVHLLRCEYSRIAHSEIQIHTHIRSNIYRSSLLNHSSNRALTRRQALSGAAWSVPFIAASAAVPAYAASNETLTFDYGVFTQVIDNTAPNAGGAFMGIDSYRSQVAQATATGTTQGGNAVGGGTFTPGGSVGNGLYGGVGLWFSAPHTVPGNYLGTTTLAAGARFSIAFAVVFTEEDAVRPPLLWNTDKTSTIPALAHSAGGAKTNNPQLKAFNGSAFTATFGADQTAGNTWLGTVSITTSEDIVASAANGAQVLNQVLLSHVPIHYAETGGITQMTVTTTLIDGALTVSAGDGAPASAHNISGVTATASVTVPQNVAAGRPWPRTAAARGGKHR